MKFDIKAHKLLLPPLQSPNWFQSVIIKPHPQLAILCVFFVTTFTPIDLMAEDLIT